MKAMILAAGRGERMRPLTDSVPKPLLQAGGSALIEYHLYRLAAAGIHEIVINLGHLGEKISTKLGDGAPYGVHIEYTKEPPGALETGGGIFNALPLLGNETFLVLNADVWCSYPLKNLPAQLSGSAHLILVDNPSHHPRGDFTLRDGLAQDQDGPRLTYSGIGVYHPRLFSNCQGGAFPLAPLLKTAMRAKQVSAEYYAGEWLDIGTPERLSALDAKLRINV